MVHKFRTAVSSYTLTEHEDVSREEWDRWLADSPGGGHALQSFTWGEFKRDQGWMPLRLTLEKDGRVAGVAQFLLYSTLPVPGYLMYAPKGPWIPWEDAEAVKTFFEGVGELALQRGVHTVKVEPEISEQRTDIRNLLAEIGFRKGRYDLNFSDTMMLDISGTEEDLMSGMRGKKGKSTRYNIRMAAREGVEVYQPRDFDRAFELLYGWMRGLAERKEGYRVTRPRAYFYDATRRMWEAGQGRFFVAVHDGDPIAVSYFFNLGRKLWYMYNASPDHGQSLAPNYLLQWEVMRWARARGMQLYDMMSIPPPEHRNESDPGYGVYRFKKGFGGEEMSFVGCLDLPVKPAQAAAWYRLEPLYYRAYFRLKNDIFY